MLSACWLTATGHRLSSFSKLILRDTQKAKIRVCLVETMVYFQFCRQKLDLDVHIPMTNITDYHLHT